MKNRRHRTTTRTGTRGLDPYYLYESENDEKPQGWGGNDRGGWSEATRGTPLWQAGLHTSITNGPMTHELDGVQFVVAGAGDSLYTFALRSR